MEVVRLKAQYFKTKLPCEKPMLKETERVVKNGPITKNGVLLVTAFLKILFWYKELI